MQTIVRTILTTVTKKVDTTSRTIKFVGTKESVDRTGDIIRVNGWEFDNFQKNPVFLWNHDSSIPPIGKIKKIDVLSKEVIFDVEFAPASVNEFADTIFKLFESGFLSAVSVGFIPKDVEPIFSEDGRFLGLEILRQELLELSAVAVPAHQDALAASLLEKASAEATAMHPQHKDEPSDRKAVSLEEYRKTLTFTEEVDEDMKEEFVKLQETVAQLQKDLAATITLRESVDLSITAMGTLNKSVVALLEAKGQPATPPTESVPDGGSMPQPSLDLEKLMGALGTALTKINESSKFTVKGDQ